MLTLYIQIDICTFTEKQLEGRVPEASREWGEACVCTGEGVTAVFYDLHSWVAEALVPMSTSFIV